jgi:hypothetical protein
MPRIKLSLPRALVKEIGRSQVQPKSIINCCSPPAHGCVCVMCDDCSIKIGIRTGSCSSRCRLPAALDPLLVYFFSSPKTSMRKSSSTTNIYFHRSWYGAHRSGHMIVVGGSIMEHILATAGPKASVPGCMTLSSVAKRSPVGHLCSSSLCKVPCTRRCLEVCRGHCKPWTSSVGAWRKTT